MEKDLEKVQSTVEFIHIVKAEKAVYDFTDPDYKNSENKALAWQRIALTSEMTVDAAKRKWKNLRDSYTKYLKALRVQGTTNSRKYQCWAHAQIMDFLKPFQGPPRSRKKDNFEYDNIQIINANDYDSISYGEYDPNYDMSSNLYDKIYSNDSEMENSPFEPDNTHYNVDGSQYELNHHSPYEMPEYSDNEIQRSSEENGIKKNLRLKSNQQDIQEDFYNEADQNGLLPNKKVSLKATDLDSTSLFFLSLAKTVRKMPTKYQARIKVQCLQVVNETELALDDLGKINPKRTLPYSRKQNNSKRKPTFANQKNEPQKKHIQPPTTKSEHFTYEMSPSNVETMIEITSSDDETAENGPN